MNPALFQRLKAQLPTPAIPKPVKLKTVKRERIDTSFLKARAVLHIRELIAEFFPIGHESKGGYWITEDFRISLQTGCFWKNFSQGFSRRPVGDVLTLFLIAKGFLVPQERIAVDGTNRIEVLKARLANRGPYRFANEGAFQRGVEAFANWLEQFPMRCEVHELVGYDS
jgi:hypothetical protein